MKCRRMFVKNLSSIGDANYNRVADAFENLDLIADKDRNGTPNSLDNPVTGT